MHDTGTTLKKRANLFEQLTFGDKTMGDLYSYLNQFFFFSALSLSIYNLNEKYFLKLTGTKQWFCKMPFAN